MHVHARVHVFFVRWTLANPALVVRPLWRHFLASVISTIADAEYMYKLKTGQVAVSRPHFYAQIPRIQNLGETEVACQVSAHLDLKHCGCALKFFHLYIENWQKCTFGM